MKHIEQILPEYAADDMTALLLSDATASAALSRLLHDWTGCAIPPLATTPESEVEELVPLCLSILRRHWTTPLTALGDGTTPMSLADLLRRLIGDRVQGNEAWSIPPANANIPTAVSALLQRDMSSGLTLTLTDGTTTSLPDGLSLAQLLCGSDVADKVTELKDDNEGWVMTKANEYLFKIPTLIIGCSKIDITTPNTVGSSNVLVMEFPMLESISGYVKFQCSSSSTQYAKFPKLKKITTTIRGDYSDFVFKIPYFEMPSLEVINMEGTSNGQSAQNVFGSCMMRVLEFPSLKTLKPHTNGTECNLIKNNDSVEEILMDNLTVFYMFRVGSGIGYCTNLKVLSLSSLKAFIVNYGNDDNSSFLQGCTSLEKIVIGEGFKSNMRLPAYNPTSVLSDSERLPIFLSNFKTYIAQRLTDKGSGLTLTLSQAVRDAIQQDPEIVSIITSKGWTISPAPSV